MPKFELLAGRHVELAVKGQPERAYHKGDIIDVSHDLVAMFGKGKFKKVSETLKPSKGISAGKPIPGAKDPAKAANESKEAEENVEEPQGKADEPEAKPAQPAKAEPAAKSKALVPGEKKAAVKPDKAAAHAARGQEVTDSFEKVADEGFVVFQRGDKFHVFEAGETTPINPKGLAKDEVEACVKEYLES